MVLALADRGIRPGVVRLPPTVHGEGDTGFIASIAGVAKDKGFAGYLGDGSTCWSAVHRDDAATLFRLAIEQESASGVLHAVADEAVPLRQIAELIGRQLGLPVEPVTDETAGDHFGWLAFVLSMDGRASSAHTRELLGWQPTRPTLVDDLEAGYYTS
jgi:nucleoside-diphosphate-sugar epimerase